MPDEQLTLGAGAPDALRWITNREFNLRSDLELRESQLAKAIDDELTQPPEEDGSTVYRDRVLICQRNVSAAEARVLTWQKQLSTFDKQVDETKRDNSEKLSRAEVECILLMAIIYLKAAIEAWASTFAGRVVTLNTPEEVYKLACEIADSSLNNALESAARESHLPEWVIRSINQ